MEITHFEWGRDKSGGRMSQVINVNMEGNEGIVVI